MRRALRGGPVPPGVRPPTARRKSRSRGPGTPRFAARRMTAANGGVILMTASTNGLTGHEYYADYNASKAGVILLARTMALELAPSVRVNAVCPGYVLTPMQKAEYTPEMLEQVNATIPLGRYAKPGEIAALS